MTSALMLSFAVVCGAPSPGPVTAPLLPVAADTIEARIYGEGTAWADFLEATDRRRDTWHANYEGAEVFADLAARVQAVPGNWRLLVVAIDSCGDSANTIPYLARFVEGVGNLELRVVEPDIGNILMEAHPTPDGRGATPTVVVLNEAGDNVGCWVERPADLQSWWNANPDDLSTRDKLERKYEWYDADGGYHTILEVVEAIEAAGAGGHLCGRPLDPDMGWPEAGRGG